MIDLHDRAAATLLKLGKRYAARSFYPGIPFILVPSVVVWLLATVLTGSLTHFPHDRVAQTRLLSVGGDAREVRFDMTLMMIPERKEFFLQEAGSGIRGAWISVKTETRVANRNRISRKEEGGLEVNLPYGADYPLLLVVEGEHVDEIHPVDGPTEEMAELELATPSSTWIVFFLLAGAVFAFGTSAGFMDDGAVVKNEDAGVDKGHQKAESDLVNWH